MEYHSSGPNERRDRRRTGRGEPRRRVRRGSVSVRRRRSGATATGRAARSNGRYRHEDVTQRATVDSQGAATDAAFGGVEPPRGLAWLLAVVARRAGAPLTASSLLWLFVYVGWRGGVLDADAVLWLSAGVVLASHALAVGDRRRDGGPDRHSPPRPRTEHYPDASR